MQVIQLPVIVTKYFMVVEQNNIIFTGRNRKPRVNIYGDSVSDRGPHLKYRESHMARGPAVGPARSMIIPRILIKNV